MQLIRHQLKSLIGLIIVIQILKNIWKIAIIIYLLMLIFITIILIYLYDQINFVLYYIRFNPSITLPKKTKPDLATIHLRKKSPYKSNIQITKGMTFQDLIKFVFPMGPPDGKRFITKLSLDMDGKVFL